MKQFRGNNSDDLLAFLAIIYVGGKKKNQRIRT